MRILAHKQLEAFLKRRRMALERAEPPHLLVGRAESPVLAPDSPPTP